MSPDEREPDLLRSVAFQNAQSIQLARQRAEAELVDAKAALERKTAELEASLATMRATLESTTDGILVTDGDGRITGHNRRYLTLWRLDSKLFETGDHRAIFRASAGQLLDPDGFVARIEEIYAEAPMDSADVLFFADGRVFERFSRVQFVDGRNVGRVWSFRDITERRRADEALRERVRVGALRAAAAEALAGGDELPVVLKQVAELLVHHLDAALTRIWTVNEAGDTLELQASAGHQAHLDGPPARIAMGESSIGRIAQTMQPHLSNQWSDDPEISDPGWAEREGIVAFAGHPLMVEGKCLGVLALFARRALGDDVVAELAPLASALAQYVQRRHTEEALRRQTDWLRVTLHSIGDAVITTDTAARVTSLNPVAEALTGWTSADARGRPLDEVFRIVNEYSRATVESPVVKCLRDGRVVGLANHTILVDRTGIERAIDDSAAPIRNSRGEVIGVVLIFRDFSERRNAEIALQRAEHNSRFLADASATLAEVTDYESTLQRLAALAVPYFADWCAVDMHDADGSLRRLAVTHVEPAKVQLAHELFQRYPPSPSDPSGVMHVMRTGQTEWVPTIPDSLLVAVTHDEEHLEIVRRLGLHSYIAVPLKSRGRVLGVISFVTAESKRSYEAEDLRAAEDLAHRAVIAIENSLLLGALKEADQRKDEFIATLAHELRNPLAPVRNAVEIMGLKAAEVPELRWARDVIDRQLRQMTRLVDDLLDVSRISRGKLYLRREPVALATVVQHALEVSEPLVEQGGLQLSVSLPTVPVYLQADAARLAQVLQNLLNNSVKFTDRGGTISLTAAVVDDVVEIRVRDTGVGIPPEMLPSVFELFTQLDRSLERTQGGLGIGLTLVHQLVTLHDGTVEARSAGPGQGSEFIVRLPVIALPTGDGARRPDEERLPLPATEVRRVLVVDDNADAAESLGMLLRLVGYEVRCQHDGLSAVQAAEDFRPHVAVLDIGLPQLNGYEVARRIRAAQGNSVTLIALTGWGQEEDRRRSREAGFDLHLTKPVDFSELNALLSGDTAPEKPEIRSDEMRSDGQGEH